MNNFNGSMGNQSMGFTQSEEFVATGNEKAEEGDYIGAIADFERAIELNPSNWDAYFNRAVALQVIEEFEHSIEDLNQVIQALPEDAQAYFFRGLAYDELEQYQLAMSDYDRCIILDASFGEAYVYRGELHQLMGKDEAALYDFNLAIENIDEDFMDLDIVFFNRGIVKHNLNDMAGACRDWKQAQMLGNEEAEELIQKHC